MKKAGLIFYLLLIISNYSCGQDTSVSAYSIGDLSVVVRKVCFNPCDTDITFINVHENESTSVEAAEQFLSDNGGTLIQLKHKGQRNLTFTHDRKPYAIDPNRMFTEDGRKASMQLLGKYKRQAAAQIKEFADVILRNFIDDKKLIVALHNNTDSNYSIISYTKPELEGNNAADVYINDEMDPDDFILTTDSLIFESLKEQQINVVLQSKSPVDDGSLSVYAEKRSIPYINVEAEHMHVEEQARMLKALKDILEKFRASE